MVTETERPLNDRNNNTVSIYPSRTSLSKEVILDEDDHDEENTDIKICDDKTQDNETDDENIDVEEESDIEDQNLSDLDSSHGGSERLSNPSRPSVYHNYRTNTTSCLPCNVISTSSVPPLTILHPLPQKPLQSMPHMLLQIPNDRSQSTSPIVNTDSGSRKIKNSPNHEYNSDNKSDSCSPTVLSPKANIISKLSFGIDRILNETKNNHIIIPDNHHRQTSPKTSVELSEDSDDVSKDMDHHTVLSDDDHDEDRTHILPFPHRLQSINGNEIVASCKVTTPTAAAAINANCLPPRILPGVDLVSPLSPFHGAVLPRDMCRMEPPSLDILPVRPAWPDVYVCPWTGVQRDRFGLVRRVGHPYQNRTPPKRKKPRTAFSRQQVLELEKRFTRQKYLASAERSALAKTLNMTDAQVKTWFQNRRTKWRRQTAEEREIERQAAHKFLLSLRPEDPNRANLSAYGALCGVKQQAPQPAAEAPKSPVATSVN